MKLYVVPRKSSAMGAAVTSATFTIVGTPQTYTVRQGMNQKTLIEIPNWTNDVTLDFKISDPNGNQLFHKDNLVRNQLTPPAEITDSFPVFEGCVVLLTLSGVPGGTGGTIYTTIYYGGSQ